MRPIKEWLLIGTSGLTGITGVVYWWMQHMMVPVDEWAVINHPLQPWILKSHILVAPLLVFALGLVSAEHFWKRLQKSDRFAHRSGLTTMWVVGPMVFSGYLIQAVTHAGWLAALVWAHLGTGAVYLGGLGIHYLLFKRFRRTPREADRSNRG